MQTIQSDKSQPYSAADNIRTFFNQNSSSFRLGARVLSKTIGGIIGGALIGKAIPMGMDYLSQNGYLNETFEYAVKSLIPSVSASEALTLKLIGLGGILLFSFAFYKERHLRAQVKPEVILDKKQEITVTETPSKGTPTEVKNGNANISTVTTSTGDASDISSSTTFNAQDLLPKTSEISIKKATSKKPEIIIPVKNAKELFGTSFSGLKAGVKGFKENREEYLHRNDTDAEKKYREYKKQISQHKSLIKSLSKKSNTTDNDKQLFELRVQLSEKKKLNPKRIIAVNTIYNAIRPNLFFDDNILKNRIENSVFSVKNNEAKKLDLKNLGFFVISKGAPNNSEIIGIAMRTDKIAEGSFGQVFNLKYLQEGGSKISPKVMKIAKVDSNDAHMNAEAKIELINEGKILEKLGGKKGIQAKNDVIFDGGYITDKMQGSAARIKFSKYSLQQKMDMTKSVLSGRKTLKDKKTYHGDIKPDNMLFNDNGGISLVLSDFGGARAFKDFLKIDSLPDDVNCIFATCTPAFVSEKVAIEISYELENARNKIQHSKTNLEAAMVIYSFNKKAKSLLQKNDDFALGLSLYSLWTDEAPPLEIFRNEGDLCSLNSNELEVIKRQLNHMGALKEAIKIIGKLLEGGLKKTTISEYEIYLINQKQKKYQAIES